MTWNLIDLVVYVDVDAIKVTDLQISPSSFNFLPMQLIQSLIYNKNKAKLGQNKRKDPKNGNKLLSSYLQIDLLNFQT